MNSRVFWSNLSIMIYVTGYVLARDDLPGRNPAVKLLRHLIKQWLCQDGEAGWYGINYSKKGRILGWRQCSWDWPPRVSVSIFYRL